MKKIDMKWFLKIIKNIFQKNDTHGFIQKKKCLKWKKMEEYLSNQICQERKLF